MYARNIVLIPNISKFSMAFQKYVLCSVAFGVLRMPSHSFRCPTANVMGFF